MPRFIAVHTGAFTESQLKELAAAPVPAGITWSQTFCGFGDGKFFCEWTAPDEEAIRLIFKQYDVPYDAIYQVRRFDVAKREFEAG